MVVRPRLFSWAVWHSCRMGARNQEQTRGRIGPQLRLGNLRVGELHFCPLCTALDQASSLSCKLAYVPGPTFGFVKLLASSGSHCTKWADEQHRQAGFESRLLPDLPLPFIPTLIGLRAFDLVSSRVWWEAATNIGYRMVDANVTKTAKLFGEINHSIWERRKKPPHRSKTLDESESCLIGNAWQEYNSENYSTFGGVTVSKLD